MIVFLLWDNTRMEKGEPPELVEVFANREAAEREARRLFEDEGYGDEDFGIEEREAKS